MVDKASSGEQCEDFGRENLELSKDLERMTEQMENISGAIHIQQFKVIVLFDRKLATLAA